MSNKTRGVVLLVAGVLLALTALGADALGLGGYPGIGWKQILGAVVGAGIAVAGFRNLRS
jgi:hypothetical protein